MALSPSQLDLIAKCAVAGMPKRDIAEYARTTPQTVDTYLSGGHSEQFDILYGEYKRQAYLGKIEHQFKMLQLAPQAYANLEEYLSSSQRDKKLQSEWTRWWFGVTLGASENNAFQNVNVNVGVQANVATEQVSIAVAEVGSTMSSLLSRLREVRLTEGPDPHEKIGDAALPTSFQVLKQAPSSESLGAKPNGFTREAGQEAPPEGTPINGTGDRSE